MPQVTLSLSQRNLTTADRTDGIGVVEQSLGLLHPASRQSIARGLASRSVPQPQGRIAHGVPDPRLGDDEIIGDAARHDVESIRRTSSAEIPHAKDVATMREDVMTATIAKRPTSV
jgi:hypothetical protein